MKTFLALFLMLAAAAAAAQDTPTTENSKKKKVIRLEAITVEGKIQKPQAFYILQRSNLNFEELNRPESFVPQVVQSVDKQPF
ncbi:hypothetical protein POL68_37945 [Stigmatella sp. ncwal1]|uniref:Uncharacterized protein n=1 Tax=Stigmatella ashevillensis TaxID=2995309 RepID=A0ABT5DMC7_9BACT|nr:hypothetical protein [Stigmatella ashevillena]MDC0714305.1 hypothetical protein [Stigmatella ashevillena]